MQSLNYAVKVFWHIYLSFCGLSCSWFSIKMEGINVKFFKWLYAELFITTLRQSFFRYFRVRPFFWSTSSYILFIAERVYFQLGDRLHVFISNPISAFSLEFLTFLGISTQDCLNCCLPNNRGTYTQCVECSVPNYCINFCLNVSFSPQTSPFATFFVTKVIRNIN